MEFYLKYDGKLKSNDNAKGKQKIREYFRPQLALLWNTPPLNDAIRYLEWPPENKDKSVAKEIGGVVFAPLVTTSIFLTCLHI